MDIRQWLLWRPPISRFVAMALLFQAGGICICVHSILCNLLREPCQLSVGADSLAPSLKKSAGCAHPVVGHMNACDHLILSQGGQNCTPADVSIAKVFASAAAAYHIYNTPKISGCASYAHQVSVLLIWTELSVYRCTSSCQTYASAAAAYTKSGGCGLCVKHLILLFTWTKLFACRCIYSCQDIRGSGGSIHRCGMRAGD